MEYRTLELNIASAKDIKDVNRFSKMDVYAVVSLSGDSLHKQKAKTHVHKDGGTNPTWNFPMKFTFNESLAHQNRLSLEIKLLSDRTLAGDTEIGQFHVPIKELLDNPGDGKSFHQVSYQVRTPSGKPKGTLNFSYKLGEHVAAPAPATGSKQGPVMAYPAPSAGSSSVPYGMAYPAAPPPQQHAAGYPYPPPQPYGGYPQPHPSYGYPPQAGYGYPPQQGYGYQAAQKPAKNKFGMGLGAGLLGGALGGLLIGDMVSDVGSYDAGYDAGFDDAGYDAGFDDAGGFDF